MKGRKKSMCYCFLSNLLLKRQFRFLLSLSVSLYPESALSSVVQGRIDCLTRHSYQDTSGVKSSVSSRGFLVYQQTMPLRPGDPGVNRPSGPVQKPRPRPPPPPKPPIYHGK
ncbi:hypothetical protein ScPMuIL_004467 [Solemya velum]